MLSQNLIYKSKLKKVFIISLVYLIICFIIPLFLFLYSFTVPFKYVDYSVSEPWWGEGTLQDNFVFFAILSFMILAAIGQILTCFLFYWLKIRTRFSKFLLAYTLFFIIFFIFFITIRKDGFYKLPVDIYSFHYIFGEKLREFYLYLNLFNPILFLITFIWQLFYFRKKAKTL